MHDSLGTDGLQPKDSAFFRCPIPQRNRLIFRKIVQNERVATEMDVDDGSENTKLWLEVDILRDNDGVSPQTDPISL